MTSAPMVTGGVDKRKARARLTCGSMWVVETVHNITPAQNDGSKVFQKSAERTVICELNDRVECSDNLLPSTQKLVTGDDS